jgi:uncharacterized glyoxalase superfamily protein PhnB
MSSPVVPGVFYKDPMAALDWLQKAFGLELGMLLTDNEGRLAHSELTWRGAYITVGGEWASPELLGPAALKSPASIGGVGTQFIRLHIDEGIDEHCERARATGARITQEPQTQFYGARTYRALDLEGHIWTFSQEVSSVSLAEMEQASGLKFQSPPAENA